MPLKVRTPTHDSDGSALAPPGGLSAERLALVHRYMTDEEVVPPQPPRLVQPDESPSPPAEDPPALVPPRRFVPLEEPPTPTARPRNVEPEVRGLKAVAKADRQAAKQAARRLAALEKKEARVRKALAKAAARRKSA